MSELTHARLKELFDYRDGELYWKIGGWRRQIGGIAGTLNHTGYHHIMIRRKIYLRSRLVYCYHKGHFSENDCDHIDRIRNNDKIENLREVSRQCNVRNTGNPKNNTSRVKGVHWHKANNKWVVYITVKQETKYLGIYKSFSNAVCARLAGEQCLNWEGCDSSSPAYQYVKENINRCAK